MNNHPNYTAASQDLHYAKNRYDTIEKRVIHREFISTKMGIFMSAVVLPNQYFLSISQNITDNYIHAFIAKDFIICQWFTDVKGLFERSLHKIPML